MFPNWSPAPWARGARKTLRRSDRWSSRQSRPPACCRESSAPDASEEVVGIQVEAQRHDWHLAAHQPTDSWSHHALPGTSGAEKTNPASARSSAFSIVASPSVSWSIESCATNNSIPYRPKLGVLLRQAHVQSPDATQNKERPSAYRRSPPAIRASPDRVPPAEVLRQLYRVFVARPPDDLVQAGPVALRTEADTRAQPTGTDRMCSMTTTLTR